MGSSILILIAILLIVAAVIVRVPIYAAIIAGTIFIQVFVNKLPLTGLFMTLTEGLNKPSLMCIPFFITVGTFVQNSTLGDRLIELCVVALRKVRSGLAIACVVANAVFGAISGSGAAAVALFGKIIYKPLEENYDSDIALGIITSSGTLSGIIPPSISMIVFGIATNTSIAKLFIGGFIPGIIIVMIVSVYISIRIKRNEKAKIQNSKGNENIHKEVSYEGTKVSSSLYRALPVLVLPAIIFIGIYGGVFTPVEAASVAVLYCLIITIALREVKFKKLVLIFRNSMKTTVQIFVVVMASIAFAQAITIAQVPKMVSDFVSGMDRTMFLILLNIILLIIGCLVETASAILIFAPIFVPAALTLGINPIHLGLIFTVNLAIGMFTPPFGMNLFVAQSSIGAPFGKIVHSVVPYMIIYFTGCLLVTYIPQLSIWLPSLLS